MVGPGRDWYQGDKGLQQKNNGRSSSTNSIMVLCIRVRCRYLLPSRRNRTVWSRRTNTIWICHAAYTWHFWVHRLLLVSMGVLLGWNWQRKETMPMARHRQPSRTIDVLLDITLQWRIYRTFYCDTNSGRRPNENHTQRTHESIHSKTTRFHWWPQNSIRQGRNC